MEKKKVKSWKAPRGKHIFGTVTVGERGQIVIPKKAREVFNIQAGDTLLVLGDESQGIAIVKSDVISGFLSDLNKMMNAKPADADGEEE